MSLDATLWAWRQEITPSQKLVLLSFADRAGENMTAFPSIKRLVQDTGLNRKTVMKCIDELQNLDLLLDTENKTGRTRQVKVYMLMLNEEDLRENFSKGPNSGTVKNERVPLFPHKGPNSGTAKGSQFRDTESTHREPINKRLKEKATFTKYIDRDGVEQERPF